MRKMRLEGTNLKGFTLVELMITLIIVAVLLALAYPSYTSYVRKAKRSDAQQLLMNWSVNQEIYKSNNPTYANDVAMAPPTHDDYTLTVSDVTASTYTLQADAKGDQLNDIEDGQPCTVMSIDQSGLKSPIECWGGKS